MTVVHWISDAANSVVDRSVQLGTKASGAANSLWIWLQTPYRTDRWINFIIKLIGVLLGTAFAWYFGWIGLKFAQQGIKATLQGNKLSAKQICTSTNLTDRDRRWCNDPRHNLSLDTIMETRDWVSSGALAARDWVNAKLSLLSLCGTFSLAERSGDTCLSIGIVLTTLLLINSPPLDKQFVAALKVHCFGPLITLMAEMTMDTYLSVASHTVTVAALVVALLESQLFRKAPIHQQNMDGINGTGCLKVRTRLNHTQSVQEQLRFQKDLYKTCCIQMSFVVVFLFVLRMICAGAIGMAALTPDKLRT